MTNTTDPFGSSESSEETNTNTQNNSADTSKDDLADRLLAIRGENGEPKYRDVHTALEALKHSQEFIPTLQNENRSLQAQIDALKQQVAERKAIEDVLNRQDTTQNQTPKTNGSEAVFSEETVAALVQKQLEAARQTEQKTSNVQRVTKTLTDAFGDKTSDVIKQVARDFNMTPERLREESSTNPDFVLKLFEGRGVMSTQPSVGSFVNNNAPKQAPQTLKFAKGATRGGMGEGELVAMWKQAGDYTKEKLGVK